MTGLALRCMARPTRRFRVFGGYNEPPLKLARMAKYDRAKIFVSGEGPGD